MSDEKKNELEAVKVEDLDRPNRPFRGDRIVIHVPVESLRYVLAAVEKPLAQRPNEADLQAVRDFLALFPEDDEDDDE